MEKTKLSVTVIGLFLFSSTISWAVEPTAVPPDAYLLRPALPTTVGTGSGCIRVLPKGVWAALAPILFTQGDEVLDGTDTLSRKNGTQTQLIPRLRITGGIGYGFEISGVVPVFYFTESDRGKENHGSFGDLTLTLRRELFRAGNFAFGITAGFVLPTGETDGNNLIGISNEQWQWTVELGSTYFWGEHERNRFDIAFREAQPMGEGADDWESGYMHRVGAAYAYAINDWLDVGYEAYWMKTGEFEYNGQGTNNGTEVVWHGPKVALKDILPMKKSILTMSFQLPAYQWADGDNIFTPQANYAADYQISMKIGFLF